MTNPLLSALPVGAKSTQDGRRYFAEAFARVLDDAADITGEDWSETPFKSVILGDAIFAYDSTDTTTTHDGTTCLVDTSGRRYKLQTRVFLKSKVDDKDTTAQPASPSVGEAYLLPASPTGDDWASKAKNVATYTERGWIFKAPEVGDIVFVEDEGAYYHYPASGTWTLGLGDLGIGEGSIGVRELVNKFGLSVEAEQNAPPGSIPGAGVAYIIGTSPTGAWASDPADIAVSNGTTWDIYPAYEGAQVYDKALGLYKSYQGGVWGISGGDIPVFIAPAENGGISIGENILYQFTVNSSGNDYVKLEIQKLIMLVRASSGSVSDTNLTFRIYRDSEASSLFTLSATLATVFSTNWAGFDETLAYSGTITTSSTPSSTEEAPLSNHQGSTNAFDEWVFVDRLTDTAAHTYKISVTSNKALGRKFFGLTMNAKIFKNVSTS